MKKIILTGIVVTITGVFVIRHSIPEIPTGPTGFGIIYKTVLLSDEWRKCHNAGGKFDVKLDQDWMGAPSMTCIKTTVEEIDLMKL